jgi:light-regulated signal transduction histidine kinase (bacteriophytochrome)
MRGEAAITKHADELARSNADLQQFAYVASHDLQEPLRMITSYLQLLDRRYQGKLDKEADEFIGFAVDGAKRMQQFIGDLLDYSRVDARGKEFEPVPWESVFDEAVANLEVAIKESGAVITREALPTLVGDRVQLVQLLQNLIGNAIKFRAEDTPRIHVSAERLDGEWRFSVADNGIGIAAEDHARAFQMFERISADKSKPGTGVGLAICNKIVERHGGHIWVESQLGVGSTFYFTMPDRTS